MAPIHDYAQVGDVAGVRRELAAGVSPNCIDDEDGFSSTPLHCAASRGNLGVLALLVAKGAELEKGDHLHWTPLTVAVVNSNIDAVALLLAAGASPSHKSRTGLMPHELPPMNPRPRRVLSVLLRAGAPLPRVSYGNWERSDNAHTRAARQYVAKIAAAGSWAAYEKAHTTRLVPVFEKVFPRPRLPHEIASHVVRFCFHTGDY